MIEVVHANSPNWELAEKCTFCEKPTKYWYTPKDVAVCPNCAETHNPQDVPTKREWLNANLLKGQTALPKGWKCNADRHFDGK